MSKDASNAFVVDMLSLSAGRKVKGFRTVYVIVPGKRYGIVVTGWIFAQLGILLAI